MKSAGQRLEDVGEDALVRTLTSRLPLERGVIVGAGDDCAVLRGRRKGWYQLFKADCVVEGVHYKPSTPPVRVGWKAMARSLSDFAAMGGAPCYAVITLVLPARRSVAYARALYGGLEKAAREYSVSIVGGETSRSSRKGEAMISVALTGEVARARCVLRSGGRAGDALYVTGRLGGAVKSGRHLRFAPRIAEGAWLAAGFPLHAMMDLSDGLAKDLPRLAAASGTGFELELDRLPRNRGCSERQALGEGEDYELLFALSPRSGAKLENEWGKAFPELRLTRIGRLVRSKAAGRGLQGGWEHFSKGEVKREKGEARRAQ